MIQVKLTSPENRTTIITEDVSIMEFLNNNDVELSGAAVSLDGITLTKSELDDTFTELGAEEQCRLTVTVKSDNG